MMFYKNTRKLCVVASLSLLAFLTSGCGMWRDFTTYFNTYYNAKTLFDRTEEDILKQKKDIFAFRSDASANSNTNSSRTSSSLQNQQNSNSLLNNNNNTFGNQSSTNQFNTQIEGQTSSQFNNQINNAFSSSQNTSSSSSSSLSTGQVKQDLTKVIEKCSKILQYDTESSYFADALFITGKAFYYQQEYARAQRKFIELAGLGKTKYSLENNLWLAKTHLQLRNFEEGLNLIEEVKAEALKEEEDEIFSDASITKISFFIFREEYTEAVKECQYFLSVSPNEETSALVSYQLGKIYLEMKDNVNALEAFKSVQKYEPTFEVEFNSRLEYARLLKELKRIDESEEVVENLRTTGRYRNYLNEILVELGQIYYEKNEIEAAINVFKDVDSTYVGKKPTAIADLKLGEIYEKKYRDYDSSYKYYVKSVSLLEDKEIQTQTNGKLKVIDNYRRLKLGFADNYRSLSYAEDSTLYFKDSSDYDFAYKQYLEENKRLIEQQNPSGQGGLNSNQNQNQMLQQVQSQALQKKLALKKDSELTPVELITLGRIKKPVRPKISADSIKTIIAGDMYSMGNLFFSELEVPDSTIYYFSKVLKDYSAKPIAVQTMYALGTFYETNKDTVKADSLFRYIYDNYEKNPLRTSVMVKLGMIKKDDKNVITEVDSLKSAYAEGEKLYYDKKFNEALEIFKKIPAVDSTSIYAPKSVYYVGMIYEQELKMYDSAAVTYAGLVKKYSKDPLTSLVAGKVQAYAEEQMKIKKAAEDKLKKEEEEKAKKEAESKKETDVKANAETEPKKVQEENAADGPDKQIKQNEMPPPQQKNDNPAPMVKDSVRTELLKKEKSLEHEESRKKVQKDSTKTILEP